VPDLYISRLGYGVVNAQSGGDRMRGARRAAWSANARRDVRAVRARNAWRDVRAVRARNARRGVRAVRARNAIYNLISKLKTKTYD